MMELICGTKLSTGLPSMMKFMFSLFVAVEIIICEPSSTAVSVVTGFSDQLVDKCIQRKTGTVKDSHRILALSATRIGVSENKATTSLEEEAMLSDDNMKPTVSRTRAPPRNGLGQTLLDIALNSPLWKYVLVPQARANIVKTAEANNIPWTTAKAWIQNQMISSDNNDDDDPKLMLSLPITSIPSYYQQAFHAYENGNLSWEAAYEVEIASAAVGARNFPQYGSKGEEAFRNAFDSALINEAGAIVPNKAIIVDFGCGTGMSTRRLAKNFPQAESIIGIDLSPYFIAVGKRLLELAPISNFHNGGPWVSTIEPEERIDYFVCYAGKATSLPQLKEDVVDVVNLQFVLHEVPPQAARDIVDEAFRLLKPNGQIWICEMDFEAPAYAAQRANALLFSLIRSTEPYLDDYAESISELFAYIQTKAKNVKIVPATGRHFVLVATKGNKISEESINDGSIEDLRFDADGNYRVEDSHLKLWESKQEQAVESNYLR